MYFCYNLDMKSAYELEQENLEIRAQLQAKEALLESQRAQLESKKKQLESKKKQLESKKKQLESKDVQIHSKDGLITQLKEALILARNRQFAKSTETLRSLQSELFDEVEALVCEVDQQTDDSKTTEVSSYQRKAGGRKPLPKDLPRIDIIHDLKDAEKVCAKGNTLVPMSDKVSEQLDIIPMQLRVIRHIRKQYCCSCCEGQIKTATKPKQPIEKSQASAGLLSYIAVSKYADSLPLYRQSQILKRFEIEINRTTMANWMIRCGELIQPLINRLNDQLLSQPYVHMDETTVQVLKEDGKPAESKSYMWVRSAGPPDQRITLFDYAPTRSGSVPENLLSGYQGTLVVDGYAGYDEVCQQHSLTRLGCWAHARRKFVEVGKASKKKNSQAAYAIKMIAKLYKIEKEMNEAGKDARFNARQEQAKPILDKLRAWCDDTMIKVPPKTALGKALHYLDNQWPRLIGYLKDGDYPIDNNRVENAIRPFTIGRKNWLFSNSVRGAKASANLYSLIETAKANDVEPHGYLKQVFAKIPNVSSYDDVDELLPFSLSQDCR